MTIWLMSSMLPRARMKGYLSKPVNIGKLRKCSTRYGAVITENSAYCAKGGKYDTALADDDV